MPEPDFISIFVSRLNQTGLSYMITGSVACIVYGVPRMTHDVDFVLELGLNKVRIIAETFPIDAFYCPPMENLIIEAGRSLRGHFNLIHHETGLRADVYLAGEDPLHHWAMAHRKSVEIRGERLWLAPPEYVVLRKLEFYREGGSDKHLKDLAGILQISLNDLDMIWLVEKIRERGLGREWQKVTSMGE